MVFYVVLIFLPETIMLLQIMYFIKKIETRKIIFWVSTFTKVIKGQPV